MHGGDTSAPPAAKDAGELKNERNNDNQRKEKPEEAITGDNTEGGEGVLMNIRCSNGSKFSVQARLDLTVSVFKSVVAARYEIPAEQQRLIYKVRILKDVQNLESYECRISYNL